MYWALNGEKYLMTTSKGIEFVEKWYTLRPIPPQITKIYQLLLRLIWMNGTITIRLTQRLGYSKEVLEQALASSYVELIEKPRLLSEEVQSKIERMIGKAPKTVYA